MMEKQRITFEPGYVPPDAETRQRLLTLRPYVRQAGDDWRTPWVLPERRLLDYLAVFIVEGSGVFSVGDRDAFPVGDGDLIWIPPAAVHSMQGTSAKMHCVYIHFDLLYAEARSHWNAMIKGGTLDLTDYRERLHPPLEDPVIRAWIGKLALPNSGRVLSWMLDIAGTFRRYGTSAALMTSGMMLAMLSEIVTGLQPQVGGGRYRADVRRAMDWMHEHPAARLDLHALAATAGLSCSHFRKVFTAQTGQSPQSYYQERRMRRACELLAYNGYNVSETAYALGFSTVQNFSRAFKAFYRLSPKQFTGMSHVRPAGSP